MNDMEWAGPDGSGGPFVSDGAVQTDRAVEPGVDIDLTPVGVGIEEGIAVAEGLFFSYIRDLKFHEAELEKLRRGEVDPGVLKKAVHAAQGLRESIQLLMMERNKVDRLRKDIAGVVGGGSLDLDAARDEIGRRLACLRRASGS